MIGPTGVVRDLNLAMSTDRQPGCYVPGRRYARGQSGTISNVTASGEVDGGTVSGAVLGGLVGANGTFDFGGHSGLITGSKADVTVSSAGVNVALGGLAGVNSPGSAIIGSFAIGDVIATATVDQGRPGLRRPATRRASTCPRAAWSARISARSPFRLRPGTSPSARTAPRAGSRGSTAASSPMRSRPATSPARPAPAASMAKAAAPRSAALPGSIRV